MKEVIEIPAIDAQFVRRSRVVVVECRILDMVSQDHPNALIEKLVPLLFVDSEKQNFLILCKGNKVPFVGFVTGVYYDRIDLADERY